MGKLIEFDKRRRRQHKGVPGQSKGQILIFTGVQYQRGPLPGGRTDPAKPKRKRG